MNYKGHCITELCPLFGIPDDPEGEKDGQMLKAALTSLMHDYRDGHQSMQNDVRVQEIRKCLEALASQEIYIGYDGMVMLAISAIPDPYSMLKWVIRNQGALWT